MLFITNSEHEFSKGLKAKLHRRQKQLMKQQQARKQSEIVHQRPSLSLPKQSLFSFHDTNAGICGYKVIHVVHLLQQPFKNTFYTIRDMIWPCVNMNPYSKKELLISIINFNELILPTQIRP